jgi:Uma2 family endonuclease
MGMSAPAYYTRAMLRDIPEDGNRYELVRGELLVTPAPRLWHEIVTQRIEHALTHYVRAAALPFHVVGSRSEVSWGDDDTEVQPDTFVVPIAQARTLQWEQLTNLLLVVEVLSPSTTRHDRFTKRAEYQRRGVPLYWIVDPDHRQAEVWTPEDHFPRVERTRLQWAPDGAAAPFVLDLEELFRPL